MWMVESGSWTEQTEWVWYVCFSIKLAMERAATLLRVPHFGVS
jgi:hypothetical protein